nr:chlorophyllide A oxygenase, chloroplastic-like [Ipomoea batatas]
MYGEEGALVDKKSPWLTIFNVEDPRSKVPQCKGKFLDVNTALEVARYDIQYCDWKARQDVLTIMLLHEKVVEVLNPLARDYKSIGTMKKELADLQGELTQAHKQVHISEARVSAALDKLAHMEALVNDKLLQDQNTAETDCSSSSTSMPIRSLDTVKSNPSRRSLNVSGPVQHYSDHLKNFWYPVAFSSDLKDDTMIPIDCFEEPWVIFRGKDGKPGCVQNTCAHRACPLHLGSVNDGRIQCPYHGWEYTTDGKCEKMPSTRLLNVKLKALPCFEQEGMIWIWPGDDPPEATLPSLLPPPGFQIHAEIVMELPVEHGLLLDNLLDLAHAPFTHTSTFAKGWSVPSLVKFLTPESGLQGYWDPYPIDMEFRPPCMVLSTIGISKPGKLEGQSTKQCSTHLHQLHVCLPSSRQKTRLLYRMSLDFAPLLKHIPFMQYLWRHFAEQVLNEDLRLVIGQQDRMINGANIWNLPVAYDKLGVRYAVVTGGNKGMGFEICRQLACDGVTVVLTARNEKKGSEAVEKLRAFGFSDGDVLFHHLDVTDPSSVSSLFHFVKTNFGRLDILVNNAGVIGLAMDENVLKSLQKICDEWAKGILNNIESPPEKLDEVVNKYLEDYKNGCLKYNGKFPIPSAYTVSKATMNAYARTIAHKYPSLQVNCVNPGYVKTDLTFNSGQITAEEGAQSIVRVALQPEDGPSGVFFDRQEIISF